VVVAAGTVVGVVVAGLVGDQHPGQCPITSQPPTRLRIQRPGPAGLPPDCPWAANQAIQLHRHHQLGPHPTSLGQPTGFQAAAGQLGEGVGPALCTAAGSWALAGWVRGSNAATSSWPASGSNHPSTATIPSQLAANHNPRR
jgi:hypothetical protein